MDLTAQEFVSHFSDISLGATLLAGGILAGLKKHRVLSDEVIDGSLGSKEFCRRGKPQVRLYEGGKWKGEGGIKVGAPSVVILIKLAR
jgi:hypothetical protein